MQDWDRQNPTQIVTEMCGFVTILSGTFLLHKTKDMVDGMTAFPPFLTFLNILFFYLKIEMTPMCNFLLSLVGMTGLQQNLPIRIPKHADEDAYESEGIPLRSAADGIPLRSPRGTEGIPLRSAADGIPLRSSSRGTESFRSTS